jgi:Galactose oxidase, central domain
MPPFFWSQKQDIGPSPRAGHAMALDAARTKVVMFGGVAGGHAANDTWTWDGSLWTQAADTGPSARFGHAMTFDADRGQVVLFGGRVLGGNPLDDTWVWDGDLWTQVADTGPSARSGHALADDPVAKAVVLFSGIAGAPVGDTWSWDGQLWTQVQDSGPSARSGHAMAQLSGPGRALLYGGFGADMNGLADTWVWDGTAWTEVQDIGPGPRIGASMTGAGAGAVLFGGVDSVSAGPADRVVHGDTWRWDPGTWTQIQDIGPSPRFDHSMTLGADGARLTIFGGSSLLVPVDPNISTTLLGDTWEAPIEAGAVPDQPGAVVVEVASVAINGDNSLHTYAPIQVDIALTASMPVPVTLEVHIYSSSGAGPPLDPPYVVLPPIARVPVGQVYYSFLLGPGPGLPPSGARTVLVNVQGGAVQKSASFLLRG